MTVVNCSIVLFVRASIGTCLMTRIASALACSPSGFLNAKKTTDCTSIHVFTPDDRNVACDSPFGTEQTLIVDNFLQCVQQSNALPAHTRLGGLVLQVSGLHAYA